MILKRRYLTFLTYCEEARWMDVKSFYVTCLGYRVVKVSLYRHDINNNATEWDFHNRWHSNICQISTQTKVESKLQLLSASSIAWHTFLLLILLRSIIFLKGDLM